MRCKLSAVYLILGSLLWWSGCSAPHDNPLDPAAKHYVAPPPAQPNLGARARSSHISRNFGSDSYSVIAELFGSDAALQDSAWVQFDTYDPVSLSRTDPTTMATVFASSYFQDPHLNSVLGRPFMFTAKDNHAVHHEIGPAYMWRVIETVPELTSPTSSDTVDAHPKFSWRPFSATFPFGYRAEVINVTEGFETPAWTSPLEPDSILYVDYPDSLPDGDYYWTLSVVDSFENSARSKEGDFTVRG
jgi:hypothetical protein